MADNYLERRQAEVNEGGRARYRTASATLETLLSRISGTELYGKDGSEPLYKVHPLQLKAIISVCERFGPKGLSLCISTDDPAHIDILSEGTITSSGQLFFDLGRCIQTASLKAAEMGLLMTHVLCESDSAQNEAECGNDKAGKLLARLYIGK